MSNQRKNILITGGAGFIGSRLALQLLKNGCNVTVLDNLSEQIHGKNPEENSPLYRSVLNNVNFIKGDVTVKQDWEKALENQDIVVHLAAETGTGQSMYEIQKYTEVNIIGTSIFLELLVNKKYNIEKVILASSRAIYGEGKYLHPKYGIVYPEQRKAEDMLNGDFEIRFFDHQKLQSLPTDEESKAQPISIYGITKQNQEQMILTVTKAIGIDAVALRYQNVYGEGQSLINPYTGILSIFSNQILNRNTINIFEDGKESRDFVHIDDVVEATIKSIEKENIGNQIFNVGSGTATTILSVAQNLKNQFSTESSIEITGQFRIGDIRHNVADISKIEEVLNFKPKVSFQDGIKRFSEWLKNQQIQESKWSFSVEEMSNKGLLLNGNKN